MNANFNCDVNSDPRPFPHYWEHTVGSGHATLALRADYQKQLKRAHDELGFKHVRFHGLFSDDMGTLVNQQDKLIYSFFNVDQIFDFLRSINMRPFVELSFMPEALASGHDVVFHYKGNITPPRSYNEWGDLIREFGTHLVNRYGVEEVRNWFFEVWNEPNLKAFWTGTQEIYFDLYRKTAEELKKIDSQLKVGGPATAKNEWIVEFTDFCEKNNVPYDFVSTHHYPTDAFGKPGDDTLTQLAESTRSVLRDQAQKARNQSKGKPLYYTEWSGSSNPFDDLHDRPYTSAFVTKTILENRDLVEGYSYWIFSDIFEENYFSSIPFHGGFGLMNIYGIPKPAYRAFQLLHHTGDEILVMNGRHETVDAWITRRGSTLLIVVTNFALPRHLIQIEEVTIELKGVKVCRSASIERIDDEHANARGAWEKMGSPGTLSPAQVMELEAASETKKETIEVQIKSDAEKPTATLKVRMPIQGTVLITMEI
jgi:xylan 1,4-beta-xylosidase